MKEHDVRQSIESVLGMATCVAVLFAAGMVGVACGNAGLKTGTGDSGAVGDGHANSSVGATGGLTGTIGSGGAGVAGTGDASGTSGPGGVFGTDATVDVGAPDAGYCGDGIVETNLGEACDLGALNGACLDSQMNPVDAGSRQNPEDVSCPEGTSVMCTTGCWIFLPIR